MAALNMSTPHTSQTAPQKLRHLLSDPSHTVVAPGVYDGISARLALAQNFECLYMTGAGTAMSRLGMADLGLTTFTDMHQNAAMIASLGPSVPVIADADTGYGGPINVAHTVRGYARAGVAGLHIEDQVVWAFGWEAAGARDDSGSGIVIIARTDARAGKDAEGNGGFDEAVLRLKMAAEIGVDALFFEALQDQRECERAIAALPKVPVLLNMVPGGKTPIMTNADAKKLGFRIVIWPTAGLEAVVPALENTYRALKEEDVVYTEGALGPGKLFEVCGLKDLMAFDESVGGKAYSGS
nr:hypothetical protein B0A51_03955 [Rachicladosporium sp. CCFEE 5018]